MHYKEKYFKEGQIITYKYNTKEDTCGKEIFVC